ncbi:unnamed protein product [Discula destructiva]
MVLLSNIYPTNVSDLDRGRDSTLTNQQHQITELKGQIAAQNLQYQELQLFVNEVLFKLEQGSQDDRTMGFVAEQQHDIEILKKKINVLAAASVEAREDKLRKNRFASPDSESQKMANTIEELQHDVSILTAKARSLVNTSAEANEWNAKLSEEVHNKSRLGKGLFCRCSADNKVTTAVERHDHEIFMLKEQMSLLVVKLSETYDRIIRLSRNVARSGDGDGGATNGQLERMLVAQGSYLRSQQDVMKEMEDRLVGVESQSENLTQMVMIPDTWINKRYWDDPRLLQMEKNIEKLMEAFKSQSGLF